MRSGEGREVEGRVRQFFGSRGNSESHAKAKWKIVFWFELSQEMKGAMSCRIIRSAAAERTQQKVLKEERAPHLLLLVVFVSCSDLRLVYRFDWVLFQESRNGLGRTGTSASLSPPSMMPSRS